MDPTEEDYRLVALGVYAFQIAGIIAGNSITLAEAAKLSAMTLGHVRSPETIGLIWAHTAYPGRTNVDENAFLGNIKAKRRDEFEYNLDSLAVVVAKLLDRLN